MSRELVTGRCCHIWFLALSHGGERIPRVVHECGPRVRLYYVSYRPASGDQRVLGPPDSVQLQEADSKNLPLRLCGDRAHYCGGQMTLRYLSTTGGG